MASTVSFTAAAAVRPANPGRRASSVAARAPSARPLRRAALRPVAVRKLAIVKAAYQDEEVQAEQQLRQWPNPEFVKETLAAFPDAGVADIEQAFCLFKEGYVWLDIRSSRLRDSLGLVTGSVHIPWEFDKKRFEDGKMVIDSTYNEGWLDEVFAKLPDKSTPILVGDMDSGENAIDCLNYLYENGYENVVGIKGGFKAWFRTFDSKFRRRVFGEYAENYSSYDRLGGGDSCGIHSSGAGFENQDKVSGDFW
eukprot:CAMPEP_0117672610 /NCGR_PEP_ID=MMETSP0804-20121206/13998_1 /TAXON_ID=1074897 /ORGANISM="Tetraselmis astigmatica, Strain CCMP880" /LENGTH=251 /DNA_ID=CAMNT_0005481227 /DNA_START=252 /DNA_END=1004 /DNA_ORIENTATION=-